MIDCNDKQITIGCRVKHDNMFISNPFNGIVKQMERSEIVALGVTFDLEQALVVRDDGVEQWANCEDLEVL